ncbi:MAG: anti-sigma factor [Candidatus Acidiferrales bacterium]
MACNDTQRLLPAYFDGELDPLRSAEFEEHLRSCAECSREFAQHEALRESLRSANLYERAPESLRAKIRAQLPREMQPNLKPSSTGRRAVIEWLAVAAAIFIAMVLGARMMPEIGGRQQTNLLSEQIVASHIRSLQPGHLYDVQSTDQHTVKPWFDGKLDFAPPVRNLADQGFPLVGGRLDYLDHRDVAALVYQRQKHFINVFVWPSEAKTMQLAAVQTIRGYNIVCWQRDAMNFCAASDLNAAELQRFAQLLQR